jgi:hypothetical protein
VDRITAEALAQVVVNLACTGAAAAAPDAPATTEAVIGGLDFCTYGANVSAIALAEERAWRRPNGTRLVESDASQLPILERYWRTVPGFTTPAAAHAQALVSASNGVGGEWSAAFLCYVLSNAGVTRAHGFEFFQRHIVYIANAARNREASDRTRPFWLVDRIEMQGEALPQPGDLLCINREVSGVMTNHSYESIRNRWVINNPAAVPTGSSHCALVVGTVNRGGQTFLETIGGNESQTVLRTSNVLLNAAGGIANPAANNIFAMIKNIGC